MLEILRSSTSIITTTRISALHASLRRKAVRLHWPPSWIAASLRLLVCAIIVHLVLGILFPRRRPSTLRGLVAVPVHIRITTLSWALLLRLLMLLLRVRIIPTAVVLGLVVIAVIVLLVMSLIIAIVVLVVVLVVVCRGLAAGLLLLLRCLVIVLLLGLLLARLLVVSVVLLLVCHGALRATLIGEATDALRKWLATC